MLDRLVAWWKRLATWVKVVIIVVALAVVVGPFLSEGEGEDAADGDAADVTTTENPAQSTPTTLEITSTNETSTASSTTTQPDDVIQALPAFEVVEVEDVSFAGAVRISLRVTVERATTRDELRAIAEALAEEYRDSHRYQAFNIFFYHYPELTSDFATLGSWDDSPYGDWSRASEVARGDYSHHQPNDETMEKDWTLLPTQEQIDLYVAYNEMFDLMDSGSGELPSDDDVFAAVAGEHDVSPLAVEEAADAVLTWMFNDTSS